MIDIFIYLNIKHTIFVFGLLFILIYWCMIYIPRIEIQEKFSFLDKECGGVIFNNECRTLLYYCKKPKKGILKRIKSVITKQ